jgi:hypothetical protein
MSTVNINLNNVQETLVSGTNIKTVNGNSLLGSGDVAITVDKVENVVKQVRNVSGGTLAIGTAVRITGATGQNPNVVVANATSGGVPDRGTEKNIIFGITTQSINNNAVGEILIKGTLKNFNTTAFDVGDFIFLPATGTTYTTTPPAPPAYQICLGLVIKKAADGEVCVNVQEPVHINDVTGLVMNRATLADRQAMMFNGSIFVNRLLEAADIATGTLAAGRLPLPTTTDIGAVKRNTGSAGQFVTGIDASGNLEYSTPTGGGDVTGAASSVNNNIAVFDGTTGKIIKDGGETIASINSSIAAKENTITAGTTGQYFRGDKTFQTLDKAAVGLGNVDNTSDANKPISSATQTALDDKVDKVTGKGLSQEDYTTTEKNKLAGIETGAQVNTVTSVATKTGAVTLDKNDVGLGNVANVDQQNADNITSGTIGGARLPVPTTTVLGGVKRNTGSAGQFVTGIDVAGELEYGTPSGGGDVTGAASSVNNNIAVFDGTTGKIIKDGGETIASINSSIAAKENAITAGTTGQYFRGDKTFQTLDKAAVGLGNVANVDQQNADNITSGTLGGARLPNPTTTVLGGVKRNTGSAGQVVSGIDASGNLEYTTPTGTGDVVGPSSVVDERIAVFDGTTGKLIKDGGVTIAQIGGSIDELQVVLLTQVFS